MLYIYIYIHIYIYVYLQWEVYMTEKLTEVWVSAKQHIP